MVKCFKFDFKFFLKFLCIFETILRKPIHCKHKPIYGDNHNNVFS